MQASARAPQREKPLQGGALTLQRPGYAKSKYKEAGVNYSTYNVLGKAMEPKAWQLIS